MQEIREKKEGQERKKRQKGKKEKKKKKKKKKKLNEQLKRIFFFGLYAHAFLGNLVKICLKQKGYQCSSSCCFWFMSAALKYKKTYTIGACRPSI